MLNIRKFYFYPKFILSRSMLARMIEVGHKQNGIKQQRNFDKHWLFKAFILALVMEELTHYLTRVLNPHINRILRFERPLATDWR